jgi:hypothetical protein
MVEIFFLLKRDIIRIISSSQGVSDIKHEMGRKILSKKL